jgi:hypothetical protein
MRGIMALAGAVSLFSAAAAEAACKVSSFATMAVKETAYGLTTSALVNGQPVEAVVSSATFFSIMPKETAQRLGLTLKGMSTAVRVYNEKGSLTTTLGYAQRVQFGRQAITNARFIVTSGENSDDRVIIGQNILRLRDAEFDLAAGTIRLMKAEGCTGKDVVQWAPPERVRSVPLEASNGQLDTLTFGTVSVNGVPMRTLFSTSGRSSISAEGVRKLRAAIVDDEGHDTVKLETLNISGEVQKNTTLAVRAGQSDVDLILGRDFFLAHRVYIANGRKTLFFAAVEGGTAPTTVADAN